MKLKKRNLFIDYIPALLTAVLIIVFSCLRQQSFIKTLPTLITLVVQILLSRANRFGFLLGGINALIYGISYFDDKLYFSLISAVLISAPIQIYSFFNWSKKHISANRTKLKMLDTKMKIAMVFLTFIAWFTVFYGFSGLFARAQLPAFDSFSFVAGTIVSLLAAFRFVESQYLSVVSSCVAIVMWVIICVRNPSNINYLIISFYNLFMIVKAAINWTKQYIEDKKEKENQENEIQSTASASSHRE